MKQIIILFLSVIISSSLFGQTNRSSSKQEEKLYPTRETVSRYHNNWTQKHYPQRISAFMKDPLEEGDIVFIGNSITEKGKDWSDKFGIPHIRNRGISGDVTDGVLKRLDEVIYYKPEAVFILIGINDLFSIHHDADNRHQLVYDKIVPSDKYVARNILRIAKEIRHKSPGTKVFVQTLLPTRRDYLKEDILFVNKWIKKNESKGFYKVIDLYSHFVDENGDLKKELTIDGVHLSASGYEKWVNLEKPSIQEIAKEHK
ncbi:GDSL-type esterase/lipase family protein [Saccharicrinis sp. FJH54]|uniref:GDSL-type esterase/lipase family protein n=1 Tax=Saccharicrinis sp. FJH54 TaxID=3344665 RepID=UPI0035D4DA41